MLSSLPPDAEKIDRAVREHWGIEKTLHWSLDGACHEDACIIKKDTPPKNLAILRRIGFNPAKPRTPEGMTTKKA
ncbi:MAG: transposase [Desulfovibrionaceae bacterium]|nr:transposase [Desulfovibrionaceae bacterium]